MLYLWPPLIFKLTQMRYKVFFKLIIVVVVSLAISTYPCFFPSISHTIALLDQVYLYLLE